MIKINPLTISHIRKEFRTSGFLDKELTRLSESIGQDIYLLVPNGFAVGPATNTESFTIYVWSTPSNILGNKEQIRYPSITSIWGQPIRDELKRHLVWIENSYVYSGIGIDITDGNFSVAELIDRKHLYVHIDIFEYGNDQNKAIFSRLIDEVIEIMEN